MFKNKSILVAASLLAATLWGCGSNYTSGGDQTGAESTLASAASVGMENCLTCHSAFSTLVQDYMVSRHGNHLLTAAKQALADPDSDEVFTSDDPRPGSCQYCHDPFGDGVNIDLAEAQAALVAFGNDTSADWTVAGSIIGCEGCHGGGQFHNGIAAGIPFATPGPRQCGQCHTIDEKFYKPEWVADGEYPHHSTDIYRQISDTHIDNPATSVQNGNSMIEGYTVRLDQQNGCVDCHYNGHTFNLAKNYQWAKSGHAGEIKTVKNAVKAGGGDIVAVTAAGADSTTGDAWLHYDWDDTASRGSCQTCHTSTGISNFLTDPAAYDLSGKGNNYSHLVGWVADDPNTPEVVDNVSSGQNEMLFCWGCHADSTGALRNPGAIPMEYTYNGATVVLPDVNSSNVCVKCHGGRGNNDNIRASRSSRAAEHHAPVGAVVFAEQTHSGFEFDLQDYTGVPTHAGIDVATDGDESPCVNCHMGGNDGTVSADLQNHHFEATTHDLSGNIATIEHLDVCNVCHGAMDIPTLQAEKDGFNAAVTILGALMDNSATNYLDLDIATTSNNNYKTVELNAYGSFQNWKFMTEEPCAYVHNNLYARRIIFDSIDWMQDGELDGTIDISGSPSGAAAADFLSPGAGAGAVPRP